MKRKGSDNGEENFKPLYDDLSEQQEPETEEKTYVEATIVSDENEENNENYENEYSVTSTPTEEKKKKKFNFFGKKEDEEKVELTEEEIAEGERIEKASYSAMSYKQLQRARVRCAEYGVEIPYLKYEFTGERKSTTSLKVMIVLTSILIAAAVAGLITASVVILAPFLIEVFAASGALGSFNQIPILGMFTGAIELILWLFAVGIPVIALVIAGYCIYFLILLIKICNATAEEKAYGYLLTNYRGSAIFISILTFAAGVALLICLKFNVAGIILSLCCFAAFAYCLALFIILNAERKKAREWFDTLPQEKQENFKAHFKKTDYYHSMKAIRRRDRRGSLMPTSGKGSKLMLILMLLEGFGDARFIYENLKNSRFRDQSVALGRRALYYVLYTVIGAGISLGFGAYFLQSGVNVFSVLMMVMAGVMALYMVIIQIPMALSCAIKQIKLNKKAIGWISLVCIILVIAATLYGLVLVANSK